MSHPSPRHSPRTHHRSTSPHSTRATYTAAPWCPALAAATPAPHTVGTKAQIPVPHAAATQAPPPLNYAAPLPAPFTVCPQLQPLNLTALCHNLARRPRPADAPSTPCCTEPRALSAPTAAAQPQVPAQDPAQGAAPVQGPAHGAAPAQEPVPAHGAAALTLRAAPLLAAFRRQDAPMRSAEPRTTRATAPGPLNSEPERTNLRSDAGRVGPGRTPSSAPAGQLTRALAQQQSPELEVTELSASRTERCAEPDLAVMSIVEPN